MLFDQRRAGGKNRGESQKQTANNWAKAGGHQASNDRHGSAETKPDQILVPAYLTQSGGIELDDHVRSNKIRVAPKATANQTRKAASVAVQDDSMSFLSRRQTAQQ